MPSIDAKIERMEWAIHRARSYLDAMRDVPHTNGQKRDREALETAVRRVRQLSEGYE